MAEPILTDLDRCEHGRHADDSCFDCPSGHSTGNLYLNPTALPRMQTRMDRNERRIGTTYDSRPIWVRYGKRVADDSSNT